MTVYMSPFQKAVASEIQLFSVSLSAAPAKKQKPHCCKRCTLTSRVQFAGNAIPEFPLGLLRNSVNKCVKKTKIRAVLKTTSCWSLGSPAPLHVGRTAAGGAALFQTDSLRAPAECLHDSTAWYSLGGGVCFCYWGGSPPSREQTEKNKIEDRLWYYCSAAWLQCMLALYLSTLRGELLHLALIIGMQK